VPFDTELTTDLGRYGARRTCYRTSWMVMFQSAFDLPPVAVSWVTCAQVELQTHIHAAALEHEAMCKRLAAQSVAPSHVDGLIIQPMARGTETAWRIRCDETEEHMRDEGVAAIAAVLASSDQDAFRLLSAIEYSIGARLYGEGDILAARRAIEHCSKAASDPALAVQAAKRLRGDMCGMSPAVHLEAARLETIGFEIA